MRTSTSAAAVTVALLLLAGCTSDPEPGGSTSTTPSASPSSAEPTPSETPSPSESPTPTTSPGGGGYSTEETSSDGWPDGGGSLERGTATRVGHHDGYDRVVWQFEGPGPVAYRVTYVDVPTGDGSGDPVPVDGEAFIEVLANGLGYPDTADCPPDVTGSQLRGTVLADVGTLCGGFEGIGQAFVGLDEQRPFKVTALTNPTRLVLDVATG